MTLNKKKPFPILRAPSLGFSNDLLNDPHIFDDFQIVNFSLKFPDGDNDNHDNNDDDNDDNDDDNSDSESWTSLSSGSSSLGAESFLGDLLFEM